VTPSISPLREESVAPVSAGQWALPGSRAANEGLGERVRSCSSILERGEAPDEHVIRRTLRALWQTGSLRFTFIAALLDTLPKAPSSCTGRGVLKQRALRIAAKVEGAAQRVGHGYRGIVDRNPRAGERRLQSTPESSSSCRSVRQIFRG
jgi:hypothetical protein